VEEPAPPGPFRTPSARDTRVSLLGDDVNYSASDLSQAAVCGYALMRSWTSPEISRAERAADVKGAPDLR